MAEQIKHHGHSETFEEAASVERDLAKAKTQSIPFGSPAYEQYLLAGYAELGSKEHALEIIASRKSNPMMYPYDLYLKAKAFMEALNYKPEDHPVTHPPTDRTGRFI